MTSLGGRIALVTGTAGGQGAAADHPVRGIATAIPLGRIGRPEEVARCSLFLGVTTRPMSPEPTW